MNTVISTLRQYTGIPNIQFIIGTLSEVPTPKTAILPGGSTRHLFNNYLRQIATQNNTKIVELSDLPLGPDHLHYTPDTQRIIGKRYYNEFAKLF